jgi:hypothetical protein
MLRNGVNPIRPRGRPCPHYLRQGWCPFKAKCRYIQNLSNNLKDLLLKVNNIKERGWPCLHYLRQGWCPFKAKCRCAAIVLFATFIGLHRLLLLLTVPFNNSIPFACLLFQHLSTCRNDHPDPQDAGSSRACARPASPPPYGLAESSLGTLQLTLHSNHNSQLTITTAGMTAQAHEMLAAAAVLLPPPSAPCPTALQGVKLHNFTLLLVHRMDNNAPAGMTTQTLKTPAAAAAHVLALSAPCLMALQRAWCGSRHSSCCWAC